MDILVHRVKRFIKWSIISFVILVISFFILIAAFFPVQRVVNYVIESASSAIDRPISVGSVAFNVFKGIDLQKVQVANEKGFSKRPLFKAKELWLSYDLRALLFERRVVITTIEADGLEFLYEKNMHGDNLSSIIRRLKGSPSGNVTVSAEKKKKKRSISVRIYTVKVRNGSMEQLDTTPGYKRSVKLSSIDLTIYDLSTDLRNLPVSARGSFRFSAGGTTSRFGFTLKEQGLKRFVMHCAVDAVQLDKLLTAFTERSRGKRSRAAVLKKKQKVEYSDLSSFLKGYTVDCSGTISRFAWRKAVIEELQFSMKLKDLQVRFDTKASVYGGSAVCSANVQLARNDLPYRLGIRVHGVSGGQFLRDATMFGDCADGTLHAAAALNGTLTSVQKLSGTVDATFRNGTVRNAAVLLPGFPSYVCEQLNGKIFDLFYVSLIVRKGTPVVGALKIKGDGIDIDQSVGLDMNTLKKQVQKDVLKEKKRLQREFNAELAKKKKEVDTSIEKERQKAQRALDAKKERMLNDLKDRLQVPEED